MHSHSFWLEKSVYQRLLAACPVLKTEKRLRSLFVYLAYCRLNDDGNRSLSSATLSRIYANDGEVKRRHDFSIRKEIARLMEANNLPRAPRIGALSDPSP